MAYNVLSQKNRKMKQTLLIILLTALLLPSCNCSQKAITENNVKEDTTINNHNFAINLFALACRVTNSENVSISPSGAEQALSMLANGAEGNTLVQITRLMNANDTQSVVTETEKNDTSTELSIANSIWIDKKLKVKQQFIKANKERSNATIRNIRLNNEALKTINNWCAEKSNDKITSMFDKLNEGTNMLILNTIYFKSQWKRPFSTELTSEEKFTKNNGEEITVRMMNQRFTTCYFENDTMQIMSKPFADDRFEMLFILPRENITINTLTEALSNSYRGWQTNMQSGINVIFKLPRFKTEYGGSLKPLLQTMGLTDAFDKRANFRSISDSPLFVDDIIQKSYVNVDEYGAEATSITAVSMALLSARPTEHKSMILNRPFIFVIAERSGNNILFIGKIGEP